MSAAETAKIPRYIKHKNGIRFLCGEIINNSVNIYGNSELVYNQFTSTGGLVSSLASGKNWALTIRDLITELYGIEFNYAVIPSPVTSIGGVLDDWISYVEV